MAFFSVMFLFVTEKSFSGVLYFLSAIFWIIYQTVSNLKEVFNLQT